MSKICKILKEFRLIKLDLSPETRINSVLLLLLLVYLFLCVVIVFS